MSLTTDYPWIAQDKPLVVSAPMMKISLAKYALATSAAGGFGFLAAGFDMSPLKNDLAEAAELLKSGSYSNLSYQNGLLPIGVGVQNWGANREDFIDALRSNPTSAVWFFAPKKISDLKDWADAVRAYNPAIKIWIQIGTVAEAKEVAVNVKADVIVVQGADAGGHGLAQRAGIISLLPEVYDMLAAESLSIPLIAAGGITDGRSTAAALALGASGVCMGTRFLASTEAKIAKGYQDEILRVTDGGVVTVGTKIYDVARGIHGWPEAYNGRGIINRTYLDAEEGMADGKNEELYKEEMKRGDAGWGPNGRITTYAGTGVGLVKEVLSIEEIVKGVQRQATEVLQRTAKSVSQ